MLSRTQCCHDLVEEVADRVLAVFIAGRKDFNKRDDTVTSGVINHSGETFGDVESRIGGRFQGQGENRGTYRQ